MPPNLSNTYINDLISSRQSSKAGSHGRGRYGVSVDVCGWR